MLNNKNPVLFKRLQKLNLSRRLEIAGSPEAGSLLSVLTPAQFSDLFPKAYRNPAYMPDVGGFRLAISRKSAEQQSAAAETLEKRLSSVEKTTADISKPWTQRLKEKVFGTGGAAPPPAQLSGDQLSAWNKIQQGPLGVNSTEGKIFGKLSDSQLASIGVTKSKDNTGVDVYQYQSPEVSREEAVSRMAQPTAGGNMKQIIDNAAKKYGVDPRIMYGIVKGESSGKITGEYDRNLNPTDPGGSFGPFQLLRGGEGAEFKRRFPNADFTNESSIPQQAEFVAQRIKELQAKGKPIGYEDPGRSTPSSGGPWHGFKGVSEWNNSWFTKGIYTKMGTSAAVSVKPEGANGQYSDDQVNKMIEQLKTEKNETRRQQLANLLAGTEQGQQSAEVKTVLQGGDLSKLSKTQAFGGHIGGGVECADLSKYYAPKIGAASGWKFHDGHDGIVPGAVIATRSYGQGPYPGGRRASDMPDGKSHYHTGVALTKPDGNGDVLILDQAAGHGMRITKVNINGGWNGEKWGAVVNGEPTDRSREAVNTALAHASDEQKSAIQQSLNGQTPTPTDAATLKPVVDSVNLDRSRPTDHDGKPIDPLNPPAVAPPTATPQAQAEVNALNAPTTPGAPPPTATVEKPPAPIKSQPLRYKFDEQAFVKEVRAKETGAMFVSDEYILNETRKGFADTPGVKYNKGVITIDDPNSPAIQQIMNDMKSHNFEHDKFLSKMAEEKKKEQPKTTATVEPPKPKEQTPAAKPDVLNPPAQVPTAPTPQGQSESKQLNAPTTPPPPQPEPKQVNPTVNPVPGASTGGSFEAPNGATFYPIDKRDDTVAVDSKTQEPLFTAKTGEGVSMNGGNIDVTPQEKMTNTNPAPNPLEAKLNNISSDLRSAFDNISQGQYGDAVRAPRLRETPNEMPNMIEQINNSIAQTVRSPSFGRAMGRVADPHFSYGNKRSES